LTAIDRKYLRDVHDAGLREIGFTYVEQHIAGGLGAFEIGSERTHDHGANAAVIEVVVLNDDMGMSITGG
jgi:hypothetical protein